MPTKKVVNEIVIEFIARDCWRNEEKKGFNTAISSICKGSLTAFTITKLLLIVSECTEALEEIRDDKPIGEELADIVIRVFGLAKTLNLPIGKLIIEKMEKNKKRKFLHGHKNF